MRALAIIHQPDAGPGVFAEAMRARAVQLDSWAISEEPAPPDDPAAYDAVLTFGGAMHADQEERHPWLRDEKELLAGLLEDGVPLLGACLGAQVLAEAAGGNARRASEPEIGWLEVEVLTEAADDPLLGPLAPGFAAFQWHSYECVLPPHAEPLARSAICVQAYRVAELAWGIQFHAEVTAEDAGKWMDGWRKDDDAVRSGLDVDALRAETDEAIGAWNELGHGLCDRFLQAVATRA